MGIEKEIKRLKKRVFELEEKIKFANFLETEVGDLLPDPSQVTLYARNSDFWDKGDISPNRKPFVSVPEFSVITELSGKKLLPVNWFYGSMKAFGPALSEYFNYYWKQNDFTLDMDFQRYYCSLNPKILREFLPLFYTYKEVIDFSIFKERFPFIGISVKKNRIAIDLKVDMSKTDPLMFYYWLVLLLFIEDTDTFDRHYLNWEYNDAEYVMRNRMLNVSDLEDFIVNSQIPDNSSFFIGTILPSTNLGLNGNNIETSVLCEVYESLYMYFKSRIEYIQEVLGNFWGESTNFEEKRKDVIRK